MSEAPSLEAMRAARAALLPHVVATPMQRLKSPVLARRLGAGTELLLKLELFQRTGTFKVRGALLNVMSLDPDARARGVIAVSAGNHAIALACAAAQFGVSAKVVMPASASAVRRSAALAYGAEVVTATDVHAAFDLANRIQTEENRVFVHPFDGENVVLGTAGVGLEILDEAADLDAVVVAIGGGGLIGGLGAAIKRLSPGCAVYGVEPVGADVMRQSFAAGRAVSLSSVATIADSLAPPHTTQGAYQLCRRYVDEIVTVDDDAMCEAMALLYSEAKLAVEPAAAASLAAAIGPLRTRLQGRRAAAVICGANIDRSVFCTLLERGEAILKRPPSAESAGGR